VFRRDSTGISYLLPIDGRFDGPEGELSATSTLATDGKAQITVKRGGFDLHVRFPCWATKVTVDKNGKPLNGLSVTSLRAGDEITIHYEMNLRAENAGGVQSRPGRKALYFGPWLLGASSHDQPDYFNELYPDNEIEVGSHRDERIARPLRFGVPIAANMCACIPAEFPGEAMKVDLRAVAEQTGYDAARWQTAFRVRESG
jgi:hypothetical protein